MLVDLSEGMRKKFNFLAFTSFLQRSSDSILLQENLYGKSITVADREMVEEKADCILSEARESEVAFLVVGDPFGYVI